MDPSTRLHQFWIRFGTALSTEPLYVEITSLTKGSECILFITAEFKVIFGGAGALPPMPGPPPPPPCACWELRYEEDTGC